MLAGDELSDEQLRDWRQACWELLVEARLGPGVFLYAYDGGADVYGESERVTSPEREATHVVVCMPATGAAVVDVLGGEAVMFPSTGFAIERLVSFDGHQYGYEPPLDHVMVGGLVRTFAFRLQDVRFVLQPWADGIADV